MTGLRRLGVLGAAALLAVLLAACGGLPTSGPVNAGQPVPDDDTGGNVIFLPDGPSKDATPQQIVEGFIAAGSGPKDNWGTAKEFLAPSFRGQWNPRAGVTVYRTGDRTLQQIATNSFSVTVTPTATVDASGELSTWDEGGDVSLPFVLAQQADGQWRITQAPDGIVLDRNRFDVVYNNYALQFFDPTWTYLVPDERWFPRLYAATNIAETLVNGGPSAWLAQSVKTAFVDGARLAQAAVPVGSDKVASVTLEDGARALEPDVRDRMQTQLEESLKPVGIDEVDMIVGSQTLPAQSVAVRQTRIYSRPLVQTGDAFGFLSGASIERIPGLSDAIPPLGATDIEVDADRTTATLRDGTGTVRRVDDSGTVTTVDTRAGLIAPTIDPLGYIWTVPESSPAAVIAHGPDTGQVAITGAWPGASQIVAQQVSRDGTRLAAVVRDGSSYALWVAGILRDRSNTPTGLGEHKVLAVLSGTGRALTWLDASTIAVISEATGDFSLLTQSVGGFGTPQRTPPGITAVAGSTQAGDVELRDGSGELFGQRGANWQSLASGIRVLAVQQGSPR